jgi:hypothetical protein
MKKLFLILCVIFTAVLLLTSGASAGADAEVTGLWLQIPNFPEGAEEEIDIDDEGEVAYVRQLDDGDLTLMIIRLPNPENVISTEHAVEIVAGVAEIDEDEIDMRVSEETNEDDPMLMVRYPSAEAIYETELDGEKFYHFDWFLFPQNEFLFWVRVEMSEEASDKYGELLQSWNEEMRFVERSGDGAADVKQALYWDVFDWRNPDSDKSAIAGEIIDTWKKYGEQVDDRFLDADSLVEAIDAYGGDWDQAMIFLIACELAGVDTGSYEW